MNGLRRRKQSGRERRKLLYLVCEGGENGTDLFQ